jgi:hypothetical protein
MFDHIIVEVALGLAAVYLVFSLLCSTVVEFIAGLLSLRGKQLERGIHYLVEDEGMSTGLLNHPMLSKLSDKYRKASYIPSENFRIALIDSLQLYSSPEKNFSDCLSELPAGGLRRSLTAIWLDSNNDEQLFKVKVEDWFSSNMVRVSGWYKRQIQKVLLLVAFILAALMNIDSIRIARDIPQDEALRTEMAKQLPQLLLQQGLFSTPALPIDGTSTSQPSKDAGIIADVELLKQRYQVLQKTTNDLETLELPIGWKGFGFISQSFQWYDWLLMILGWFISAFAASMGADFWFSSIGKVINLRSGGKPASGKK